MLNGEIWQISTTHGNSVNLIIHTTEFGVIKILITWACNCMLHGTISVYHIIVWLGTCNCSEIAWGLFAFIWGGGFQSHLSLSQRCFDWQQQSLLCAGQKLIMVYQLRQQCQNKETGCCCSEYDCCNSIGVNNRIIRYFWTRAEQCQHISKLNLDEAVSALPSHLWW